MTVQRPTIPEAPASTAIVHRLLVVDDHPGFRRGIVALITDEPDLAVCGEADSAPAALEAMRRLNPDGAVLDISMPGTNGIELIKMMLAERPKLPILVLSMHEESLYALRALKAGAKGYLMKNAPHDVFEKALRRVVAGGFWLNQEVADEILAAFSKSSVPRAEGLLHILTDRELEVFQLIGDGLGTAEIAESLHISPKTVDVHRANIRTKLQLPDGAALIRFAIRWVEARRTSPTPPQ